MRSVPRVPTLEDMAPARNIRVEVRTVPNITIKLKNGETKRHDHKPRPGGSKACDRKDAVIEWAIVTDEYGNQTCYPAADIEVINSESTNRGW